MGKFCVRVPILLAHGRPSAASCWLLSALGAFPDQKIFLSLSRGLAFTHLPASLSYFFGFSYALLGVCPYLNVLKCAKPCRQCFAYLYYNYFSSINIGSRVLRTSTSLITHIFCTYMYLNHSGFALATQQQNQQLLTYLLTYYFP